MSLIFTPTLEGCYRTSGLRPRVVNLGGTKNSFSQPSHDREVVSRACCRIVGTIVGTMGRHRNRASVQRSFLRSATNRVWQHAPDGVQRLERDTGPASDVQPP